MGQMQPRQPVGIPSGGQFASNRRPEAEVSLEPDLDVDGVGSCSPFRYERGTGQVRRINYLLGAGATFSYGPAVEWWLQHGRMQLGVEGLWTEQSSLGRSKVDEMRVELRSSGVDALTPPSGLDEMGSLRSPLVVVKDGQAWLLDGHHRLSACAAEGVRPWVRVADLDALADQVGLTEPHPVDDDEMLDHIVFEHMVENEEFSEFTELTDGESDPGNDIVCLDDLIEWHDEAHDLGLADHRHE